jgi:hypothetical protein
MTKQQYSRSTQAVSDAAEQVYWDWGNLCPASADTIAAAALRAAANLLNQAYANEEYVDSADEFLCDIATELEETK